MLEWPLVAKKERLIGCHRLDRGGHERSVAAGFERQHQVAHAGKTLLSGERKEPTFEKIMLVRIQREAGVLFQGSP